MAVKRIKLDSQCENLVLAEDVYKDRRILLVSKGKLLTESLILQLRRHGISRVYVYEKP